MRIDNEARFTPKVNGRTQFHFPIIDDNESQVGDLILTSNAPKKIMLWFPVSLDDFENIARVSREFHITSLSRCGIDKGCGCH